MGQPNIAKLAQPTLAGEVLGTIPTNHPLVDSTPKEVVTQFDSGDTQLTVTEPPPPWELGDNGFTDSDARRFVEVPKNWTLRWLNPRWIEVYGWRDWQPVLDSDERVSTKVKSMVMPDGTVRRGGANGDLLAWMYQSWVASRERLYIEATAKQTASAVARQDEVRDDLKRGKYGPYVKFAEGHHPTHTIADGRTMRD